jgi:hypothetical protein
MKGSIIGVAAVLYLIAGTAVAGTAVAGAGPASIPAAPIVITEDTFQTPSDQTFWSVKPGDEPLSEPGLSGPGSPGGAPPALQASPALPPLSSQSFSGGTPGNPTAPLSRDDSSQSSSGHMSGGSTAPLPRDSSPGHGSSRF